MHTNTRIHNVYSILEIVWYVLVWISILKDAAGALLPERVDLLAGKPDQKAVFLLVLRHVLDDVCTSLRHGHSLDGRLASQLVHHATMLLEIVGYQVHDCSLGKAYGDRLTGDWDERKIWVRGNRRMGSWRCHWLVSLESVGRTGVGIGSRNYFARKLNNKISRQIKWPTPFSTSDDDEWAFN